MSIINRIMRGRVFGTACLTSVMFAAQVQAASIRTFDAESGQWQPSDMLAIEHHTYFDGDFDGNGVNDRFVVLDHTWFISFNDDYQNYEKIQQNTEQFSALRFGDFDGNGETDVFRTFEGRWQVRWGARGSWESINTSGTQVHQLEFGDFDGDGKTDIFHPTAGKWMVSWAGRSSWQPRNTSGATLSNIRLGDFDGDGKTDVFHVSGNQWLVSKSGKDSWEPLNSADLSIDELHFGDFDGNGTTDVFHSAEDGWFVRWGGTGDWEQVSATARDIDRFHLGNVKSNGGAAFITWPRLRPRDKDAFSYFAADGVQLEASDSNRVPRQTGDVIKDANGVPYTVTSLRDARVICAIISECKAIFEAKSDYIGRWDGAFYRQNYFYFLNDDRTNYTHDASGVVHRVISRELYNHTLPNVAPSYWDNNSAMKDNSGALLSFGDLASAKEACTADADCFSIFEVRANYNSNGKSYQGGRFYLFSKIIQAVKVNAIAGVIHRRKNLPLLSELDSL